MLGCVCVCVRYQTGATGSRQLPLCLSSHQRRRVRFAALSGTEVRLCAECVCVRACEMRRNCLIRGVKSHRLTPAPRSDQIEAEPGALRTPMIPSACVSLPRQVECSPNVTYPPGREPMEDVWSAKSFSNGKKKNNNSTTASLGPPVLHLK